jgi:hypothetical protein
MTAEIVTDVLNAATGTSFRSDSKQKAQHDHLDCMMVADVITDRQ